VSLIVSQSKAPFHVTLSHRKHGSAGNLRLSFFLQFTLPFFHKRVSNCRTPSYKQVLQILQTFFNKKRRFFFKRLQAMYQIFLSFLAKNVDFEQQTLLTVPPTNNNHNDSNVENNSSFHHQVQGNLI
jgi:hypothetical protein